MTDAEIILRHFTDPLCAVRAIARALANGYQDDDLDASARVLADVLRARFTRVGQPRDRQACDARDAAAADFACVGESLDLVPSPRPEPIQALLQ